MKSAADRVAVTYLMGSSALFLLVYRLAGRLVETGQGDFRAAVVRNVILTAFILLTARPVFQSSPRTFLHSSVRLLRGFYPLVFVGFVYVQVGLFVKILFRPLRTFDYLVQRWDAALFGVNPHMWLHQALPGRFWAELMHLLYVLYFPLLVAGFLYVMLRRRDDYERFAFVFICAFLSFCVIFVAFPADGPMPYREGLFGPEIVFSRLVDFLFSYGIPLSGGAFPSSHVGQSVILLLLLLPLGWGAAALVVAVTLGIGISMGYASVHYSIDAVVGVPAGAALYYLWNWIYRRWVAPPGSNVGSSVGSRPELSLGRGRQ